MKSYAQARAFNNNVAGCRSCRELFEQRQHRANKGQKLVTLEAMKMEHSLTAPFDGIIAELNAATGGQVSEGMVLVRMEAPESTSTTGNTPP